MEILLIISGLITLILGGNWLLKSAVAVSVRLQIPKIVVGMTIVSFATSAPELIVSLNAALKGSSDLALSNVVGSNIANIGLILGITLLFGTMQIKEAFYKTDWPMLMFSSVALYLCLQNDNYINRTESVIFIVCITAFLVYLIKYQTKAIEDDNDEIQEIESVFKIILFFIIGGFSLWLGSELLVTNSIKLATKLGVSERIIGLTVVSIGTSIPELAASIIAVIKKEKAISLGNIIGSNIFNIFVVLGLTSLIHPIQLIDFKLLNHDIFWMLAMSISLLPLVLVPKKNILDWKTALVLLSIYSIFMYTTL